MLLRTLWCRLGAQLVVERKPVFICASASLSQSGQPRKYESKPRTPSNCSGPWTFSRTCYFNTQHQQQKHARHVLPASGGFRSLTSTLITDPGILAECRTGQKRLYSSDIVKSMLKPSLKPAIVSGKRVPKGPRTKQPSRTNQPSLNEDKVVNRMNNWSFYDTCNAFVLMVNSTLCFSVGYDAMYCLCNSRSVSFTNTLPRLD